MFICLLKKGEKKKKRGGRKKKLWGWNKIWRVGQEGFGNIASKISEGGGKKNNSNRNNCNPYRNNTEQKHKILKSRG